MADVSHELGSLRFVVDSPLSSKVAMFNNQAQQHKQAQLLNPFSESHGGGRASPKPTFSKDEYGKPLAGSLTEARGQKANIHVMKEMLELCQIISTEGYDVKDEPGMRVITFGELFNIYNYISDKCVGILLRARKYKLVEFEGEMLFQRRDDDVPIFLLRPIADIRQELDLKIDDIKRSASPAPQSTTAVMGAVPQQKLKEAGTDSKPASRSPSPSKTKTATNADQSIAKPPHKPAAVVAAVIAAAASTVAAAAIAAPVLAESVTAAVAAQLVIDDTATEKVPPAPVQSTAPSPAEQSTTKSEAAEAAAKVQANPTNEASSSDINNNAKETATTTVASIATDNELPTIVIEASACYVRNNAATASTTNEVEAAPTTTAAAVVADAAPVA